MGWKSKQQKSGNETILIVFYIILRLWRRPDPTKTSQQKEGASISIFLSEIDQENCQWLPC